ncbi:hypothetical protein IJG91_00965 [Candidatus Saccharibacteria bacterium]|nr:hypothetical protein [Candidatus Saccharibacteria bacterium]
MSDDFSEGHSIGRVISSSANRDASNTQVASSYERAMSFFAALDKIAPNLKKFDFKNADIQAEELTLPGGEKLIDSYEYQSAKHDFENLAKIRDLLKNCHFRTAKIEYDFREVGCGGCAFDEMYQRLHDNALKNAVPVLIEAISSRNFDKAKVVADELLKTYDDTDFKNYDRLIDLIKPDYHFIFKDDYYYVPIGTNIEDEDFYEKAVDAFEAIEKIAEAGDNLEKILAIIWLVDYQIFEVTDYFIDDDFLNSDWFEDLLDDSLADKNTDFRLIIKLLLTVRVPKFARRIFEKSRKPKLTEEDYYEIVAEVAEEISEGNSGDNQEVSDENIEATEEIEEGEHYDDTI